MRQRLPMSPLNFALPTGHRLAFARRWCAWAAVGIALLLVAGFVELSEEVLGADGHSEELLAADNVVLRFVAGLRRPWLNGVSIDLTALGSPLLVALFTFCLGSLLLARTDRAGAGVLVASSFTSGLLGRPIPMKTLASARLLLAKALRPFAQVQPGEAVGASAMMLGSFLLLSAYYLLKTVREPLILLQGGAEVNLYARAFAAVNVIFTLPWIGVVFAIGREHAQRARGDVLVEAEPAVP